MHSIYSAYSQLSYGIRYQIILSIWKKVDSALLAANNATLMGFFYRKELKMIRFYKNFSSSYILSARMLRRKSIYVRTLYNYTKYFKKIKN